MFDKLNKLFLKITSPFKLILIKILLFSIFSFNIGSAFANNITERNLAYNYCKSIESNMFKGLDNERILKYEYLFNSINKEAINVETENLENFTTEVENICGYKLTQDEAEDFRKELKKYLSNN
tara:strand:+ start:80 stop:451 length:372 start_codon:yes stop_codon:yes gene_type:complete